MGLISHLFISSLAIFGLWNAFNEGFIFHKVDLFLSPRLPDFIYSPLIGCVICMPSIWGSAYYFTFVGFDFGVLAFVPALSGLNLFVRRLLP